MVSAAVLIVVFLSAVVRGGGRPPWDLPDLLLSFGPVLPPDIWLFNDAADLNQFVNSITKLKEIIATPFHVLIM